MNSVISWILTTPIPILFVELFLTFGPAGIILFSKRSTGKIKIKWFFYWVISVTFIPIVLSILMAVVLGEDLGLGVGFLILAALPVFIWISGWLSLYFFTKKNQN